MSRGVRKFFFHARNLWEEVGSLDKGIRLVGITITGLDPITFENIILPLWDKNKFY